MPSGTALAILGAMTPCPPNPPPDGFVDLVTLPNVTFAIAYATPHNFTGAPVPGYAAPGAWMWHEAAVALGRVATAVERQGLGLLVWDAYRPERAATAMCAHAEQIGRHDYIADGWLAPRSAHSRGVAVDLTLTRAGVPLDMGTAFDAFVAESHHGASTPAAEANRRLLSGAMVAEGFEPYRNEWWHYRYAPSNPPPRDVPYGSCEPAEAR